MPASSSPRRRRSRAPTTPASASRSKQALERSLREAVARGDRRIGTEHLLLGLLDTPAVTVARLLTRLDARTWRLEAPVPVELASRR